MIWCRRLKKTGHGARTGLKLRAPRLPHTQALSLTSTMPRTRERGPRACKDLANGDVVECGQSEAEVTLGWD